MYYLFAFCVLHLKFVPHSTKGTEVIESKSNVIPVVTLLKIGVIPNLTHPQPRARKYSCQISFSVLLNLFSLVLDLMVKGEQEQGLLALPFGERAICHRD